MICFIIREFSNYNKLTYLDDPLVVKMSTNAGPQNTFFGGFLKLYVLRVSDQYTDG